MINSTDAHDLELEDVEDYSSDYPPTGFPQGEENIAAIGSNAEYYAPKKRSSQLVTVMRSNKWTSALVVLVVVVAITMIAIVGGGGGDAQGSSAMSSGKHQKPITIDPESLDVSITGPLMRTLLSLYDRKGLDPSVLDREAGDTAQRKAFYWMATDVILSELDHTETTQRYALAVLYYATNAVPNAYEDSPKPWLDAHLWLSDEHVCNWKGISCDEQEHVETIDLAKNFLSGSLPLELGILSQKLTGLEFSTNMIYMEGAMFDVFEDFTRLETLLVDDNYLFHEQGLPPQFEKMESMKKIRLSYNLFAGQLESSSQVFANMQRLTHLELESNFLSGSLPPIIGELTNLVYLYIRRNDLDFNLDFLKGGKLTDLFALWLDSNAITGNIPTELGLLTELASLSISNATLTGPIPTEIGNLVGLRRLWLYGNQLTGTIPAALRKLSDLEILELHHNSLEGPMPTGMCTIVEAAEFDSKSLTSDCKEKVQCDADCCTGCY